MPTLVLKQLGLVPTLCPLRLSYPGFSHPQSPAGIHCPLFQAQVPPAPRKPTPYPALPGASNIGCRSWAISLAIRAASTAFSATLLAATALRRASAALSGSGDRVLIDLLQSLDPSPSQPATHHVTAPDLRSPLAAAPLPRPGRAAGLCFPLRYLGCVCCCHTFPFSHPSTIPPNSNTSLPPAAGARPSLLPAALLFHSCPAPSQ